MNADVSFTTAYALYKEALQERDEWEAEWRQLSEYLLPGRGIYQTVTKPRKRKLTSTKVINSIAEDALYVLTSGMHGGLTSPSMKWFDRTWADDKLNDTEQLKAWLQKGTDKIHDGFHASNFYSIINSFYIEYAGFGTACIFLGEDTDNTGSPYRFELLTVGEYCFTMDSRGRLDNFFRTSFKSIKQIVDDFPNAPDDWKKKVDNNESGINVIDVCILEWVSKNEYEDKAFTRVVYILSDGKSNKQKADTSQAPLIKDGFYEMPYIVSRWNTIGSDILGIGPGSRALPDIKRLQQMEKAFLMATHKSIDPPINAPARMKGKLNTLPGGQNYYPGIAGADGIKPLYELRFDYSGVSSAVERVEQRIQRCFFNDVFLTASRDPNASPLKAAQVHEEGQEKLLRLGPVIQRLIFEMFNPLIERAFNILMRRGAIEPIDTSFIGDLGEYKINVVSPLAAAQKLIAMDGIKTYMGFLANVAPIDQTVMDNIDLDYTARFVGDITGMRIGVLRPQNDVNKRRADRAKIMAQEKQKQEAAAAAQIQSSISAEQAQASKNQAEAGIAMLEGQQMI